jgi:hypothetical protein
MSLGTDFINILLSKLHQIAVGSLPDFLTPSNRRGRNTLPFRQFAGHENFYATQDTVITRQDTKR